MRVCVQCVCVCVCVCAHVHAHPGKKFDKPGNVAMYMSMELAV